MGDWYSREKNIFLTLLLHYQKINTGPEVILCLEFEQDSLSLFILNEVQISTEVNQSHIRVYNESNESKENWLFQINFNLIWFWYLKIKSSDVTLAREDCDFKILES